MTAHEATSPHQFGKYMVTKEHWNQGTPTKWTSWRLYQQGEHPHEPASMVGVAEIRHSKPEVYNLYPGPLGQTTPSSENKEMLQRGYGEKWARRYGTTRFDREGGSKELEGQIPMFKHTSDREAVTLDSLIMSKGARHMAGTLLGVAANESTSRGFHMQTPDSLSVHSQRMVEHLKGKGAVQEGHTFSPNNLDWVEPTRLQTPGGLEGFASTLPQQRAQPSGNQEYPETAETVKKGQRTARQVIGRRRRSEAFTQGTLF